MAAGDKSLAPFEWRILLYNRTYLYVLFINTQTPFINSEKKETDE